MRLMSAVSAAMFVLVLGATVRIGEGGDSLLRIEGAWARRAPMEHSAAGHGTGNGAVYVTIRNEGPEPDALLAAETASADAVEIHEVRDEGGVMRMRPLPRVDVPAGHAVEMRPGGIHIMLLGLRENLEPGRVVTVTLRFERAGRVTIQAPVR
jgi:copper(I)-binding protein